MPKRQNEMMTGGVAGASQNAKQHLFKSIKQNASLPWRRFRLISSEHWVS